MSFTPSDLTAAQIPIVKKPTLGGEMRVLISPTNAVEMGTFTITGANAGTLSIDAAAAAVLAATPMDLVLIADGVFDGGASDPVVTLACLDNSGTPTAMNAVGTFKVPAYADLQTRSYVAGWAVDAVPATSGKLITAINSATVACAADAANAVFKIFAVPAYSTFKLVGCTNEKGFTFKSRKPMAIGCGLDRSAFVKPGEISVGELSIKSKWISLADGLSRFVGRTVTALVEVKKEDRVISERILFIGYVPDVRGDGPEVETASFDGTGLYEDFGFFLPQKAA